MDWEVHQSIFQYDGNLLDIYVFDTNIQDWQNFIDVLKDMNLKLVFYQGGTETLPPDDIMVIFSEHNSDSERFSIEIHVDHILLKSYFFLTDEIELDLDPRDIGNSHDFQLLLGFMTEISSRLSKELILTPESMPRKQLLVISPP